MTREEILSHVDHTLLKPEATWPQIQTLCDEAIANHTASVCINTCYVKHDRQNDLRFAIPAAAHRFKAGQRGFMLRK